MRLFLLEQCIDEVARDEGAQVVDAFADADARYPTVEAATIDGLGLDVVLLPSEPYRFTEADGPDAFPQTPTALFDGRLLTWYGPTLLRARRELTASIATAVAGSG